MTQWIEVCAIDDVEAEDVIPFEHEGHQYAIYRSPDDEYHATDGWCTHERALLKDGLVMGNASSARSTTAASTTAPGKARAHPSA